MKRRYQLLFIFAIILLVFSCGEQCYEGRVAIMYAFDAEGQLLRGQMSLEDSLFSLGRVFWIGKLKG